MINVHIIIMDLKGIRYDLPSTNFRSTFLALISFCASFIFIRHQVIMKSLQQS